MTDRVVSRIGAADAATLRTPEQLARAGLLVEATPEIERVAARYAIAVTPAMASLIDRDNPNDPIARQYIPRAEELVTTTDERADPIGDHVHSPVEGIVHRYPDRVLLKIVHACAVYCRFCFRREMVGPGGASALSGDAYSNAIDYITTHPDIWEVILTGGDPLIVSPRRLREIVAEIAAIPHVKIIRFHTRIPVVDPARVTAALIEAIKADGATTWLALHANHAREFTDDARAACARIVDAGIPMVSQSVLLRGVNDNAATLEALMRAFVECRIKPYYLHHGDLAPGTAHLRTTIAEGQALMEQLRGRVSGLCQPDYVLDIPGGFGKVPVGSSYISYASEKNSEASCRVRDYCGDVHDYPPAK